MHRILLCAAFGVLGGCATLGFRTGIVTHDGTPAFQASIEIGTSRFGQRRGVSLTHEHGVQTGDRTTAIAAVNADVFEGDPETGPVARIGARMRGTYDDNATAFLLRGGAYLGIGGDPKKMSAGLGIEFAGGVSLPDRVPVFEANIVFTGRERLSR